MRSMTGFASSDGRIGGDSAVEQPIGAGDDARDATWRWEARSVNGRGLEVRMRLPYGWDGEEAGWRADIGRRFKRGTVSLTLSLSETTTARPVRVNWAALDDIVAAAKTVQTRVRMAGGSEPTISVDGLLALRGVLESNGGDGPSRPSADAIAAVSAGLSATLDALERARSEEGARLKAVLSERLDEIESLVAKAERQAGERRDSASDRLRARVAALLDAGAEMDESRLAQELALLAVKQDVSEEIDRLRSHIAGARRLLEAAEPVGRKLDFLTQEFNREANTLCAKSQDAALTETGLALKVVVDQLREQAANVE